jgi:hypothetical protein
VGELLRGKQTAEIPDYAQVFLFTSPVTIDFGTLQAGDIIVDADVVVETTFDDPTAILTLGLVSSPGNILPSNAIDPTLVGTYNNSADFPVTGADALRLQVLPGTSTQGAGRAVVTVRRKAL